MISERKLIRLIKKNYKGNRLSLKKLAETFGSKISEFYPTIKNLESKGIVELYEIREIGREEPVDIEIIKFIPPKVHILQHPLIEKIIYFLLGVLITLTANYIWYKCFKK